jgi:hypothetical protein
MPFDRRGARRKLVGERKCAPRLRLPIYFADSGRNRCRDNRAPDPGFAARGRPLGRCKRLAKRYESGRPMHRGKLRFLPTEGEKYLPRGTTLGVPRRFPCSGAFSPIGERSEHDGCCDRHTGRRPGAILWCRPLRRRRDASIRPHAWLSNGATYHGSSEISELALLSRGAAFA